MIQAIKGTKDILPDEVGAWHRVELLLNSVGDAKCRPAFVDKLREALRANAASLCVDCQRRAETNPLRVLDCKVPADQEVIATLPQITENLCAECRDHYDEVRRQLRLLGIPFTDAPRLARGLDYYTRTAFEIVSGGLGAQNTVLVPADRLVLFLKEKIHG